MMWKSDDIDDLQLLPSMWSGQGYAINIREPLMADDLKPFVVSPAAPARRWHDDLGHLTMIAAVHDPMRPGKLDFSAMSAAKLSFKTIFLVFPNLAAARASSLGVHWRDK